MPVTSALVILLFVMSIFAVISVALFGEEDVWNFGECGAGPSREEATEPSNF